MEKIRLIVQDVWAGKYFCDYGLPKSIAEVAQNMGGEYYRASEVDAYRKAVRALVEAAKLILHNTPCQGFYPDCDCVRCKFKQAIAAVERMEEVK